MQKKLHNKKVTLQWGMSAGVSDEPVFTIPSEEMNISTCIYFSYDASILYFKTQQQSHK